MVIAKEKYVNSLLVNELLNIIASCVSRCFELEVSQVLKILILGQLIRDLWPWGLKIVDSMSYGIFKLAKKRLIMIPMIFYV